MCLFLVKETALMACCDWPTITSYLILKAGWLDQSSEALILEIVFWQLSNIRWNLFLSFSTDQFMCGFILWEANLELCRFDFLGYWVIICLLTKHWFIGFLVFILKSRDPWNLISALLTNRIFFSLNHIFFLANEKALLNKKPIRFLNLLVLSFFSSNQSNYKIWETTFANFFIGSTKYLCGLKKLVFEWLLASWWSAILV